MKPSWTNRDVLPVLLPRSDRTPLAWKNGGGVSFDIARGSGRGPDGFDWRIGIAAIDTAGAFSSYAGYARCLWLMSGAGLALDIGGKAGAWIDRPGEGIVFDGAAIVTSRLLRGPVRVLNLMHLIPAPQVGPRLMTPDLTVSGPAVVVALGTGKLGTHAVATEDAVWLPAQTPPLRWSGEAGAVAVWLPVTSPCRL